MFLLERLSEPCCHRKLIKTSGFKNSPPVYDILLSGLRDFFFWCEAKQSDESATECNTAFVKQQEKNKLIINTMRSIM